MEGIIMLSLGYQVTGMIYYKCINPDVGRIK